MVPKTTNPEEKEIKIMVKKNKISKKTTLFFFFLSVSLFAQEWHVKKSADNLVKFISSTTLLDFEGITSNIDGYIYWEGDTLFEKNNQLYFEVPVNSIETGIGKRDRDMREIVLESHKFPTTFFEGKITEHTKKEDFSEIYDVSVTGEIFISGYRKEITIAGVISFVEGEMNVKAGFSILLSDFNIEAPSLVAFMKVADEIKIELDFNLLQVSEN